MRRDRMLRALVLSLPVPIEHATADMLDAFLTDRRLEPRSRSTYIGTMRAFFKWAVATGRCLHDPTRNLGTPRLPRLIPRPIADSDLRHALDHSDPTMRAWLSLAAYAGLRCYEIARLSRQDIIDTSDPPMLVVSDGKGGHQRAIPLHPDILTALRAVGMPHSGPVFRMSNGCPWREGTVSVYISRHMRGLGIDASAHQLRHWFATKVYQASHDIRMTQHLMGHASIKTTAIYAAWAPGDAVGVVQNLGSARSGPVGETPAWTLRTSSET